MTPFHFSLSFFLNNPAPTEIYPLPLPDALPIKDTVGGNRVADHHKGPDTGASLCRPNFAVNRVPNRQHSSVERRAPLPALPGEDPPSIHSYPFSSFRELLSSTTPGQPPLLVKSRQEENLGLRHRASG